MEDLTYQEYLAHHGVKGQKWGQRRYQNEDGSLTAEGRNHYNVSKDELKRRFKDAKRESRRSLISFNKDTIAKAELKKQIAEKALKDSKIHDKLSSAKRQSKRESKWSKEYQEQGMSKRDADIAAYKRARTQKLLAIAGVVAISSLAVYEANKHKVDVDTLLPKGTTVQTVTLNRDKGVSDAFYVSYTKKDKKKYEGMYGGYQLQTTGKHDIHLVTTQTNRNSKIAGLQSGKKTANDLIKSDPEYAKVLRETLNHKHLTSSLKMPGYRNAMKAIRGQKELNREGYLAINTALNDRSKSGRAAAEKLYEALKKKGYDGLVDTNDVFTSGYKAQKPVIFINGKEILTNRKVKTLSAKEIRPKSIKYIATISGVPLAFAAGRSYAQSKAQKAVASKVKSRAAEKRLVNSYKKAHPNTKLNDEQIINLQLKR